MPRSSGMKHASVRSSEKVLLAILRGAKVLAEKRNHMILEAKGYSAGMSSVKNLKAVLNAIGVENLMDLGGVETQAVLIADVQGDRAILPEIVNVLVDEGQG